MKKTKNIVFIVSAIIGGGLLVSEPITTSQICDFFLHINNSNLVPIKCLDFVFNLSTIFEIFIPVFFFSLITYFMKEEVFLTWFKFARIWTPLTVLLTLISPGNTGGGFFEISININGAVAFLMSLIFILISLSIIVFKLIKTRKK